jgi:hypothetical protein
MDVDMNCTDTKNRIMVGKSDRVIKARTSFVLSFAPMIPFLLSNRSLTRFRTMRKRRRRSKITFILIRAKTSMLLENGRPCPRSRMRIPI